MTLALGIVCLAAGCSQDESGEATGPTGTEPTGQLLSYAGCKEFGGSALLPEETPEDKDCVEYTYDGHGTLLITHVNAGFNCCQDEIVATIEISDDLIRITEAEVPVGGLCDCNCLFDLEYEITDLTAGTFRIEFAEPYVAAELELLEFDVDLSESPAGSHCVTRTHYPWRGGGE
jgi:hypothetical protein